MIKAVLFDLFETLITESGLEPTRASSLAAVLGLDPGVYRTEWKRRRPRVVVGQMSFAEALAEISRTVSGRVDTALIERICRQRMVEKAAAYARIDDETTAMIETLGRRGVSLAVISNGFEEDVRPWPTCVLARTFQCAVFSCAEGVAKPDPDIYERAIRRLGADPATTVFIGDGGDQELAGAARAGLRAWRAAWFVREAPRNDATPVLADRRDVPRSIAAG